MKLVCEECKSPFERKPRGSKRFCSKSCGKKNNYNNWAKRLSGETCVICNNPLNNEQKSTCSIKCKNILNSKNISGLKRSEETKKRMSESAKITSNNPNVIEKRKNTNLKRYGGVAPSCSEEIRKKMQNTMVQRYGVKHPMDDIEIRQKLSAKRSKMQLQDGVYEKVSSEQWWLENYNGNLKSLAEENNISHAALAVWAKRMEIKLTHSFESTTEKRIQELLNENNMPFIIGDRELIHPRELDIFIPSKNIAIEINGIYWHSELNGKNRYYHLQKTNACKEKGVQLLHFWDTEIDNKFEIVSSMILSKLGITKRTIGARKCVINKLDKNECNLFMDENHIQGSAPYSENLALVLDGEILAAITFSKPRFTKKHDLELVRFCVKKNCNIPGAFSRLLMPFKKFSCVTYADRRYSNGGVYEKNGFNLIKTNPPSYKYTDDYFSLENRMKFQKSKLSSLLEDFDPSLSEWENMQQHGYDRIWDCGTLTYTLDR